MAHVNANVNADLEKAKAEVGKKIDEGIEIAHIKKNNRQYLMGVRLRLNSPLIVV